MPPDEFTTDPALAQAAICSRRDDDPGYFDDNQFGHCIRCNHPVIFRPPVPAKMPKICTRCYMKGTQ